MIAHQFQRSIHDEQGFTLIELLVAMVAALVVTGALYAIYTVALHQSTRITAGVQAAQTGRTTMSKIVDELHSACLAYGFTPIQQGSGEAKLIFINGYGSEPEVTRAYKHEIEWTGEHGALVDKQYPSTGSPEWAPNAETPTFTFSAAATKTVLATNVSQTVNGVTPVPLFQYRKYATASSGSSESGESTLTELSPKASLNETTAPEAAAVLISYKSGRSDTALKEVGSVDMSDLVTFAFTAPSAEAVIADRPCQ